MKLSQWVLCVVLVALASFGVSEDQLTLQTYGVGYESEDCEDPALFGGAEASLMDCQCRDAGCFLFGEEELLPSDGGDTPLGRRLRKNTKVDEGDNLVERRLDTTTPKPTPRPTPKPTPRPTPKPTPRPTPRPTKKNTKKKKKAKRKSKKVKKRRPRGRLGWCLLAIETVWEIAEYVFSDDDDDGGRFLQEDVYEVTFNATCDSGVFCDPHIKQLAGGYFDYHGECDLVFAHAPDFGHGVGLDIHVRTTIRYHYSFISTAAIRIGNETLEVTGFGEYVLNGVNDAKLPNTISGYPVSHTQVNDKKHVFGIEVGDGSVIEVDTMKDMVSVDIVPVDGFFGPEMRAWLGNSTGLMGSLDNVYMLARDGVSTFEDPNAMGQEWQVRDWESKMFQNPDRPPQYPQKCLLPSLEAKENRRRRRRLGEGVSKEQAEKACGHVQEAERKKACMMDVMVTDDVELAEGYD
ncbi:unknown protein [Seminavis robusta]|uniref:VWFD domain-containing protein n=1 Tax=Seminavis robusta TaxID=568900 RepID=A0A9N8DLV7_9STRA|nr:unknown protein [Seminavis robusta]|eukprot:Sro204_g085850.1 n/a (462) ;mRNA; r:28707-30318